MIANSEDERKGKKPRNAGSLKKRGKAKKEQQRASEKNAARSTPNLSPA